MKNNIVRVILTALFFFILYIVFSESIRMFNGPTIMCMFGSLTMIAYGLIIPPCLRGIWKV